MADEKKAMANSLEKAILYGDSIPRAFGTLARRARRTYAARFRARTGASGCSFRLETHLQEQRTRIVDVAVAKLTAVVQAQGCVPADSYFGAQVYNGCILGNRRT